MKYALIILVLLMACNRKAAVQKSSSIDKGVQVKKFTDSSFTTSKSAIKEYIVFGDTLKGGWVAIDSVTVDSLESTGIKIIATTHKQTNGTVKTNIVAIAKPKEVVNENQAATTTQTNKAGVDSTKHDVIVTSKTKQVESKIPTIKIVIVILIILAVAALIYLIKQKLKF